jgi:lysophospholipase L1-like esterase
VRVTRAAKTLIAALGAGLLVGTGAPAGGQVAGTTYVALGDSYAAGPLIPNQLPGPWGCFRSDHDYPHLVAGSLGEPVRDVSCSGAATPDMTAPQDVFDGANPPQLSAVDGDTRLVTLTIGGNDIGFTEIAETCATLNPFGTPCQRRYVDGAGDEISRRIAETGPKVGAVLTEIRRRAPQARVFVVGYPAVLPDSGIGCWPVMPYAYRDVPYLRAREKELNAMLSAQAAGHDAVYVDTYGPSIGHDACALPGLRWVEPVVPLALAAPVHPNAAGMAGVASVVTAAIRASGAVPTPS